jgi:hypothetical protein
MRLRTSIPFKRVSSDAAKEILTWVFLFEKTLPGMMKRFF